MKIKISIIIFFFLNILIALGMTEEIDKTSYYDTQIHQAVEIVTDEISVKFKVGVSIETIDKINEDLNVQVIKKIKVLRTYLVEISTTTTLEETLKKYKENPNVQYAEPNFVGKTFSTVPNDTYLDKQWAVKKLDLDRAWDIENGASVIVAVLDTGIDLYHLDLKKNIISGYDFVDNDKIPMDDNGHGTLVAGVIGAYGNNNEGVAGVNWYCKLMPVRVTNTEGIGTYFNVAQGIIYAVENKARAISLSIGGYSYSDTLKEAVDYAISENCVIIGAIGDDNTNVPVYPAAYPGVIAVGSTNPQDKVSSESNWGEFVDIFAPGVGIYSTDLHSKYNYRSGSSMAVPYVSGLVALILSANSGLTNTEVEQIIYNTADYIKKDFKNEYGKGRINTYRAITKAKGLEIADIAIVDLKVTPEIPVAGQETKIIATLQNQGTVKTSETNLRLFIDELPFDTLITVPELLSNEVITKTYVWRP
ncbi:MAG: S8 family serine peptidase [Elusimicrobiota bacterium]